jgi:hypothetical protein
MKRLFFLTLVMMFTSTLYADERCDYVIDPAGNYIISCPNFYDNPSYYDNQDDRKSNRSHH